MGHRAAAVAADARSFAFHVSCIFGRRRNIFIHPGLEVGSIPLYFHRRRLFALLPDLHHVVVALAHRTVAYTAADNLAEPQSRADA